uniref:Uncharacterized protein n=1 Tax=Oryza punctata TaxID=4537 RepID=A0A0E0K5X7_ORYPU
MGIKLKCSLLGPGRDYKRNKPLPTPAHILDWVFTRRGESPLGNTSKEDTAPAGVDVADPGRLGRAFARDSLKRCRTSKKPKQKRPKEGRSIKEGRPGRPEEELRAEDRGIKGIGVIYRGPPGFAGHLLQLRQPPPTSPLAHTHRERSVGASSRATRQLGSRAGERKGGRKTEEGVGGVNLPLRLESRRRNDGTERKR